MSRVLVCGGRDYEDATAVFKALDGIHAEQPIKVVIEGGARGADRLGRQWANERGVAVSTFPARWDLYGRRAGMLRNHDMLQHGKPDKVVAFPGGAGTADMMRIAQQAELPVIRPFHLETSGPSVRQR